MIRVAVLNGGHPYDVPGFHALFRGLKGIDPYLQHMDDYAASSPETRASYDTVVFFHFLQDVPGQPAAPFAGNHRQALEDLFASGKGFVVWHHALLCYSNWPVWDDIVGARQRLETAKAFVGESIRVEIADPRHPIMRGLKPWTMTDETYTMTETEPSSHALLTVECPRSIRTIGWTRTFGNCRVFDFQPGHDPVAWSNRSFREVLRRGILWCAKKL